MPAAGGTVRVLGVRHHSPACARLVRDSILERRPARVLIEGPADFTDRIDELLLGHTPPVALYSYLRTDERSVASYAPFCEYSPEWVALYEANRVGAETIFIDLPAWHPAFDGRANRYGDAERRYAAAIDRLCAAFTVDSVDALWDHLVELPAERMSTEALRKRLDDYFEALRGDTPASPADSERESHMLEWILWARALPGDTLVVTGGFHQPALLRGLSEPLAPPPRARPRVPAPPEQPDGGSPRRGTYVIPFSDRRLDAFGGYQSGMPSPGYYRWLWRGDAAAAADAAVRGVVARLRTAGLPVSSADLVAAGTLSRGLADLRGHRTPSRTDVLDGLVGTLIADDLPAPPPWIARGAIADGAHPAIAVMVQVLTGDAVGRLHPDTPAPPLVDAVEAELAALGLADGEHRLDLGDPRDQRRSAALHRLRVLDVPGLRLDDGLGSVAHVRLAERWNLRRGDDWRPALIEAGAHGPGPAEAAVFVLRDRLRGADLAALASALFDALLCGLGDLVAEVLVSAAALIDGARDLDGLARLGRTALALWRHGEAFAAAHQAAMVDLAAEAADRGADLLYDSVHGGRAPEGTGEAVVLIRDLARHGDRADRTDLAGAVTALAVSSAPPLVRGACTGLGWSLGTIDATTATARRPGPADLGDWLTGLFTVARQEALEDRNLLRAIDGELADMTDEEFLRALPALREAFEHFPPRERERLAQMVLAAHGQRPDRFAAGALLRASSDPIAAAHAAQREARIVAGLVAEGLR